MADQSCIQDVFIWLPFDELPLLTDGFDCPSGRNTNVESVVWAEAILASKNDSTNRDIEYLSFGNMVYDTTFLPMATSGIYVPGCF